MIDPESQCHLVFIFTLFSFRIQQFFHRSQRPASQPQLFVFELHHGNSNNSKKYGERCKYRHWQSNKKALSLTQTLSLSLSLTLTPSISQSLSFVLSLSLHLSVLSYSFHFLFLLRSPSFPTIIFSYRVTSVSPSMTLNLHQALTYVPWSLHPSY